MAKSPCSSPSLLILIATHWLSQNKEVLVQPTGSGDPGGFWWESVVGLVGRGPAGRPTGVWRGRGETLNCLDSQLPLGILGFHRSLGGKSAWKHHCVHFPLCQKGNDLKFEGFLNPTEGELKCGPIPLRPELGGCFVHRFTDMAGCSVCFLWVSADWGGQWLRFNEQMRKTASPEGDSTAIKWEKNQSNQNHSLPT